nr:MAG TPA: hypothetical protein [Caudoviricetes sp.]
MGSNPMRNYNYLSIRGIINLIHFILPFIYFYTFLYYFFVCYLFLIKYLE